MPNRLALCGLAVVVAVTLAGCGGEDSPKSDPTPSAKPSPTGPPGLDATEPPRPTKQAETPESALEYGRYFAQLVQYGVETRNSRVIDAEAFDQAGCTNCRTIAALISDLKRTGYWQLSDPIKLGKLRAIPMRGRHPGQGLLRLSRGEERQGQRRRRSDRPGGDLPLLRGPAVGRGEEDLAGAGLRLPAEGLTAGFAQRPKGAGSTSRCQCIRRGSPHEPQVQGTPHRRPVCTAAAGVLRRRLGRRRGRRRRAPPSSMPGRPVRTRRGSGHSSRATGSPPRPRARLTAGRRTPPTSPRRARRTHHPRRRRGRR